MQSSSAFPVVVLLAAACSAGCRCSPSEEQLPPSRTASPNTREGCPALPKWASPQGQDIEADLQHVSMAHGTGYRLRVDGRLETYDDTELVKDDAGKSRLVRSEGKWRTRGVVAPEGIRKLREAIAAADPDKLVGKRTGKGDLTKLSEFTVTRDGKRILFCYAGDQAPPDLLPIEQAFHDLVKLATSD